MDIQLQVFVEVVEKENFSKAAEKLHMTQPAVSQYIQALESKMGTRLLERSNKFVRLNKAGNIVYHHAKEIIDHYTKMKSLVDDLTNTSSGDLSIGASYTFGEYILPHTIAYMRKQYPAIKPKITIGNSREISELVSRSQLDVGIVEGEFKEAKLKEHTFSEDLMYVIASPIHPLMKMEELKMENLQNETWIVRESGSGTREATDRLFQTLDCKPDNLMEFGSNQIIKESVEAGLGISFMSQWAIRKELSIGTIQILQIPGCPVTRTFTSITKDTPFQLKVVDVFLEILHQNLGLPTLV